MSIDFIEATHEYSIKGRVLPSVTRVLVALGLLHTVDDESALERGRSAHEACRMVDQGCLDRRSVDPIIAGYLEAWERLRREKTFRVAAIEKKVANLAMGCAGRYDRKIVMDGERMILEIKTGPVQRCHALQLVAYAEMETRADRKLHAPLGRIAAHLSSDGAYQFERYKAVDYSRDLRAWMSAVNLYVWNANRNGG